MPRIGIFWVYRGAVLGRALELNAGEEGVPGLLDSPASHVDLWENDARLLAACPELRGREYFEVPRGRVLWDKRQNLAIVYLDTRLFTAAVKAAIAAFFDLADCEISWRTDPHYTT